MFPQLVWLRKYSLCSIWEVGCGLSLSQNFCGMQILLKDGTYVNLRSWNARRFHGQMLSLKRNIVWRIVAGPPSILHMSVKSTFWLVGLIRFVTCPFFHCFSNLNGSYSLTLWSKPWNFRMSKCIKIMSNFPTLLWREKVIIAPAIYFLHSLTCFFYCWLGMKLPFDSKGKVQL